MQASSSCFTTLDDVEISDTDDWDEFEEHPLWDKDDDTGELVRRDDTLVLSLLVDHAQTWMETHPGEPFPPTRCRALAQVFRALD